MRLFAVEKQKMQCQWGFTWFLNKGMCSWIAEKIIHMSKEQKTNIKLVQENNKGDFQCDREPKLMQIIADILLKKIKDRSG